ncbi:MAG: hypothetical protein AAGC71_03025 [Pseudomonadota bacterium]
MQYLLYEYAPDNGNAAFTRSSCPGQTVEFTLFQPRWIWRALKAGRLEFAKVLLLQLWGVLTGSLPARSIRFWGYVSDTGHVLHFSVVTPTSHHLPNIARPGFEVGGCYTVTAARGQKLYPTVLSLIAQNPDNQPLYMIVESANTASRTGMERANFKAVASLTRNSNAIRPPQYVETSGPTSS